LQCKVKGREQEPDPAQEEFLAGTGARNKLLTCVIKTNSGGHFSAITMIPTMISLDAYETLTCSGRDLAPRVASPSGHDREKDRSWQLRR